MGAHTPIPWRVGPVFQVKAGRFNVAPTITAGGHSKGTADEREIIRANAEFIVRAVNSHELLVAALKETLSVVNGWLDDSRGYPPEDILASDGAWHKRALEALAAAGEQP